MVPVPSTVLPEEIQPQKKRAVSAQNKEESSTATFVDLTTPSSSDSDDPPPLEVRDLPKK
jgi:hypothetical protein